MLGPGPGRGHVPLAQHPQPPAEVAPAIAARGPVMRPHGQMDRPPRAAQLVRDLHARRTRTDDQHRAGRQLVRVAVVAGMDLRDARIAGNDGRDDRLLERPGRGHDALRLDDALRGLDPEAGATLQPLDRQHLDPGADGRAEAAGIGFQVSGHDLLVREVVGAHGGIDLVKGHAGKAVVPGGAVRHKGIPARRAPAFGDPVAFQHQMRDTGLRQVLAHREPRLPGADHKRVCRFHRHSCILRGPQGCNRAGDAAKITIWHRIG